MKLSRNLSKFFPVIEEHVHVSVFPQGFNKSIVTALRALGISLAVVQGPCMYQVLSEVTAHLISENVFFI